MSHSSNLLPSRRGTPVRRAAATGRAPAALDGPENPTPLLHLALLSTVVMLTVTGCSDSEREATHDELPVYSVELVRSLGNVDGDTAEMFHDVSDVLWGPEGSVIVADRGTQEISTFDRTDHLVRKFGGPGEGPGEFNGVSHLYRVGHDSIGVLDTWTHKLSVFGSDGAFGRTRDAFEFSFDSVFPMDVWISGRRLVHGALGEEARRSVEAILVDYLPPPDGFQTVVAAEDGPLWLKNRKHGEDSSNQWIIVNPDGLPDGTVSLPQTFTPMTIHGNRVIGRWVDELGIHYVREYGLAPTRTTTPHPHWLMLRSGGPGVAGRGDSAKATRTRQELTSLTMPAVREIARNQEIHYSTEGTYTKDLEALALEASPALQVFLLQGDTRGWVGLFAIPGEDRMCGLAYGFTVPPGWAPGGLVCGS